MLDAHALHEMLDVVEEHVERRVGLDLGPRVRHRPVEERPDEPARIAYRFELPVGEVARDRRECVRRGMRGDERRVGEPCDVGETGRGQVRQVDHDSELVAGAYECAAGGGEPGPRVGSARVAEGDAAAEGIRPAPGESERAHPARPPGLEVAEIRCDRLGALEVEDRADLLAGKAALQVGDGEYRRQVAREDRSQLRRDPLAALGRKRRLERKLVAVRGAPEARRPIGPLVRRRHEDREEAGRDPAFPHARQVELSLLASLAERAAAPPDALERVVVAVDDGDDGRSASRQRLPRPAHRSP